MYRKTKKSNLVCLLLCFALICGSICFAFACLNNQVQTVNAASSGNTYTISASGTYQTADNQGYYPNKAESRSMSFNASTFGNLTISGVQSQGSYSGKRAYSLEGSSTVSLKYTLKYGKTNINESSWNLSGDSATSVNGISLNGSSISKGCVILEKKNLKDKNYTVLLREGNVFNTKNNYETTSLSGEDINYGCYYRLSVAYEIYRSWQVKKGWWIFKKWVTEYEYKNCLEVYEFFVGRNSCNIQLLDLAEKDYSSYSEDEAQINLIKKGDTLQDGSVTSKGFKINYLENKSYKVQYSRNGASYKTATDGMKITQNGKYVVKVTSLFGNTKSTTIYVYNGGADKGYATYFGNSIFNGKQITDLSSSLPVYQTGVKVQLNGVGNYIPQLRGQIVNQQTQMVTKVNPNVSKQSIELKTEGVYYISLHNADENLAGTYYSYEFAFVVSNKSTYPSINRNNVLTNYSIFDYDTKHIEVKYTMDSGKTAYICFDKDNYDEAYQFAYAVEKKYITEQNGVYIYNGKSYTDNLKLVEAINEVIKTKISYQYFTKALDNFYVDEDLVGLSIKVDQLNYNKDVYVSTAVNISKMLNKENIIDGNFRFVKVGDYESKSLTAKNLETNEVYKLKYNTKVSQMLNKTGNYLITETNCYGESINYKVVYANSNETKFALNVDGVDVIINRNNYQLVKGTNISINSISNEFDSDGVIVVANLSTKQVETYDYEEIVGKEFNSNNYLLSLIDRSGNVYSVILSCSDIPVSNLTTAINSVKNQNAKVYEYILRYGVSSINGIYQVSGN